LPTLSAPTSRLAAIKKAAATQPPLYFLFLLPFALP
jgi:hypothetical protein